MIKTIFPRILPRTPRLSFPLALMAPLVFLVALTACSRFLLAHAAEEKTLAEGLIQLWGSIQGKAAAAVVIMHVFQILRTHEVFGLLGKIGLSGKGLQVAIAVITALGFVADAYGRGAPLGQALIEGLFTAGGAMLIFDAFKKSTAEVAQPLALTGGSGPVK